MADEQQLNGVEKPISISSLAAKAGKTVNVQYKDTSWRVEVSYYGKSQMRKLFERCTYKELNSRTMGEEERLDNKKFRAEYAREVIVNWTGLTFGLLKTLVLIDPEAVQPADDIEIACTRENREFLIEQSWEFDNWLAKMVSTVEKFNAQKVEGELKNSETMPTG